MLGKRRQNVDRISTLKHIDIQRSQCSTIPILYRFIPAPRSKMPSKCLLALSNERGILGTVNSVNSRTAWSLFLIASQINVMP